MTDIERRPYHRFFDVKHAVPLVGEIADRESCQSLSESKVVGFDSHAECSVMFQVRIM